jgi:polyvinyl alcohol dehydrogenase (cytochrome)
VLDPAGERLVVPIGSWEEPMGLSANYECCTSRGAVAVLDVKSGRQIWKTHTLADEARPLWKNKHGVQQYGPSGAAVWSAPTIDPRRNAVYVGTSNAYVPVPDGGASDAIFAFDPPPEHSLDHHQNNDKRYADPNTKPQG